MTQFIWPIAVFCAFFVKGITGFANTLMMTSLMGFFTEQKNITPLDLILGYPANCITSYTNRHKLDAKIWALPAVLIVLGALPGTFLLKNMDASVLKFIFGLLTLLIVLQNLLDNGKKRESKPWVLVVVSLLSGILCGMFGIGALLAAYMRKVSDDAASFKANISLVFLIENTVRISLYIYNGILTTALFYKALLLIPMMLAGLWLGQKTSKRLPEDKSKKLVYLFLFLMSLSMIVSSIQ